MQFTLRAAGVLSSCGVSAKVSPQILLRLRPRIVWLMKDVIVGGGGLCPGRCFAALPRNLAPLWRWMEDLAVAAFYPRALGLAAFLELIYIP